MPIPCRTLTLWFATALLATGTPARAAPCEAPPPAVRDLDLPRYYTDPAGTLVEPATRDRLNAITAPLTAFLGHVTRDADSAVRGNNARAAACAVSWLAAWAKDDAWLGGMATNQAEYQRKWDLVGAALAYLKVRPWAKPAQRAVIEPWLIRFADAARAFFDDAQHRRNNHWYWLGLGAAAVGLSAGSERHWTLARQIMTDATRDISGDGTLAFEMERGARALHYHLFSLTPLVALAELGAARGEDWYALGDGALHRLAAVAAAGLLDRGVFDRRAGVPQDHPDKAGAGWTTLYRARFAGRLPAGLPEGAIRHRWLGGDVTLLSQALARASLEPKP